MWRILRFLFIGKWELPNKHEHLWEIYDQGSVSVHGRQIGRAYILRCKVCGDMKHYEAL